MTVLAANRCRATSEAANFYMAAATELQIASRGAIAPEKRHFITGNRRRRVSSCRRSRSRDFRVQGRARETAAGKPGQTSTQADHLHAGVIQIAWGRMGMRSARWIRYDAQQCHDRCTDVFRDRATRLRPQHHILRSNASTTKFCAARCAS